MNAKNAKSLTAALMLSLATLSTANAADAPRVGHIVDLATVTVRPDAGLRAELAANGIDSSRIVELPTVSVRPEGALRAELAARTMVARIVDLPGITVRPTVEQLAERTAIIAAERAQVLTVQLTDTLLTETVSASLD